MNTYVLSIVSKWFSMLLVSVISFFGVKNNLASDRIEINAYTNRSLGIVNTVIPHDTEYLYSSKIPSNVTKLISEGENGIKYIREDGTEEILRPMVSETILKGTGEYGEFYGIMTGYGPDCYGCSAKGYVACRTESNQKFSLIDDGLTYKDDEYGDVKIVAAALSKFSCGTIVYVENSNFEPFYAVVLDTGSGMRGSLANGIIHFDLAFPTEKAPEVSKATNKNGNIKYSVQRWGW